MTDLTVTVHFQSTGTVPGNGRPVTMFGGSMTIGRGPENDLVLPDSDKAISKRHCAIELSRGVPVAVDMSTNGTFLNYGKIPIGDVPTPLNDGDVLTIGTYELLLEIREAPAVAPSGPVPGWDYVLIGLREATAARAFDALLADLRDAVTRLHAPRPER